MADVGLEDGDVRLLLADLAIQARHLGAQLFGGHVVLANFFTAVLGLGVDGVQVGFGLGLILLGGFQVRLELQGLGAEGLEVFQPHGDLQHAELVAVDQILLRRFGLLAQGLHLELQLGNFIVDPHQVFLGALHLALGLLLAVAVFGDTGGLLEDLTALTALDGQNLVDLALADDGVALPAHAGVHEELVHILEADGLLIDVVLGLTAAVVPAGHRHLRFIAVKNMLRVVDHQRDLGKAHGAALGRAAENDILHFRTAELTAALLAHDPADGVGNIGLAAAVGTHDGRNVLAEIQDRFIGK